MLIDGPNVRRFTLALISRSYFMGGPVSCCLMRAQLLESVYACWANAYLPINYSHQPYIHEKMLLGTIFKMSSTLPQCRFNSGRTIRLESARYNKAYEYHKSNLIFKPILTTMTSIRNKTNVEAFKKKGCSTNREGNAPNCGVTADTICLSVFLFFAAIFTFVWDFIRWSQKEKEKYESHIVTHYWI